MRDSVDDALALASDAASPLANSLKRVVEKTKVVVDFIDNTAKVSIAVGLMSSTLILSNGIASPVCLCRVEHRLVRI